MDAGAVRAGHGTLAFGVGLTPAFGSASLDGFALGASVVLLALMVMKSPKPLSLRWRPAGLWQRVMRLTQALAGAGKNSWSRFRHRADLLLVQMLGDAGQRPQSRTNSPTRAYAPRHAAPRREPLSPPH